MLLNIAPHTIQMTNTFFLICQRWYYAETKYQILHAEPMVRHLCKPCKEFLTAFGMYFPAVAMNEINITKY
jgi:hypothetical protein